MPNEKYSFNFTVDELKETNKQLVNRKKAIVAQTICVAILPLLVAVGFLVDGSGFLLGVLFLYVVILISAYIKTRKSIKENFQRITNNTYQYEFFDDEITVNIIDAISTRTVHIKYTDITSVKELKNHFVLMYANQYYFLRKSDLIENAKITTL